MEYLAYFPLLWDLLQFYRLEWDRKSWKMVGLGNYIKMLHDSRFLRAMRFNITYTLLLVVIVIALAMILAVMMDKMKWGKPFSVPFISFRLF